MHPVSSSAKVADFSSHPVGGRWRATTWSKWALTSSRSRTSAAVMETAVSSP